MSTNRRLLSILIVMSLVLFAGVMGYQVYRVERDYKRTFLVEKTAFGEQVARIALSGMQTSDYFGIVRLGNELYKPEAMLYLSILDETGQTVHFRSEGNMEKIRSARSGVARDGVRDDLDMLGKRVAIVRSLIVDDAGKSWGNVEIAYFWAPVQRLLRRQTLAFTIFFLVFVSIWGAVLSFSARSILDPLDRFVRDLAKIQTEWPISLEEFNARLVPEKATSDVNVLLNVLRTSLAKLLEYQENQRKEAEFAALGKLSAQVAHDVRSPLAALESLLSQLLLFPEEERLIARSAINRIRDIANNLLKKNRADGKDSTVESVAQDAETSVELLSSLIEPLISEKRLSFRSKLGVEIDARMDASAYGLFARVQPREFKRLLSNLLNNSVEALGASGSVTLALASAGGESIVITVRDDGPGIPPAILAKLGKCGETHGKVGGSGLGLYHARTSVESWGGSLELLSEVGRGTTAVVHLPKARPPEWFVSVLELDAKHPIVVLDDDASIHQVWQGRFDSLRPRVQIFEVLHFSAPTELRDWVKADATRARDAVYLMDYELLGYKDTGLALIAELGLGEQAILVTSRFEEKAILEECLRLKTRMIPKGLAGFVPIRVRAATGTDANGPAGRSAQLDAVLIDDDPLTRMTWKMAASRSSKKLQAFSTVAEFLQEAPAIDRETPIYIDADLADGVNGAQESLRIHELGFQEIYLATGHEAARFAAYTHLRGVVGKEPPWS
ncbi:MAG: hypothetical protein A2V88_02155 [Elusimicrobia bacterium RBG_16_66_12]|nr:MAG: hypothetical protein A2V88_02155 [Elusimicrobia bacterium RBG_16_66_12]